MPTLGSPILFVGYQPPTEIPVESDFVESLSQVSIKSPSVKRDVLVLTCDEVLKSSFIENFKRIKSENPAMQAILLQPHDLEKLADSLHKLTPARIADPAQSAGLESHILWALERSQFQKQDLELENLVKQQNEKMKGLYQELEARVEKRQNFLLEAHRKSHLAQTRWELTRHAMLAIQRSFSIGEIERNLSATLNPTLQLETIRIFFKPQDSVFAKQTSATFGKSCLQTPLFKVNENVGTLFFIKPQGKTFQREETDFLNRISEGVSLAIDRLTKQEQAEVMKEQWQATFNAVSDPIALINENYDVVQHNSAYAERAVDWSLASAGSKKCYQWLFGRQSPCTHCQLGKNFRLDSPLHRGQYFDVYSQSVQADPRGEKLYVQLYHDVTEQLRMERKILESARLAELGTIGSSIAHELNNPLGGVLSFVQLIKMDLKPEDPLYPDIVEMEQGVNRCKEIIQNLLSFTRDPLTDKEGELDLREVIQRSAKLMELQTKSRGIEVKLILPKDPCLFHGHFNLLSQALKNLLQTATESVLEKMQTQKQSGQKGFHPTIEIKLSINEKDYEVAVLDNGLGSPNPSQLNISIASQIFHDHRGHLEFFSQSKHLTLAKISLPRT